MRGAEVCVGGMCRLCVLCGVWCSECRSPRESPSLYPEAKGILHALKQKGVTMAVASRTPTPDIARNFLNKLSLVNHFADMVSVEA